MSIIHTNNNNLNKHLLPTPQPIELPPQKVSIHHETIFWRKKKHFFSRDEVVIEWYRVGPNIGSFVTLVNSTRFL